MYRISDIFWAHSDRRWFNQLDAKRCHTDQASDKVNSTAPNEMKSIGWKTIFHLIWNFNMTGTEVSRTSFPISLVPRSWLLSCCCSAHRQLSRAQFVDCNWLWKLNAVHFSLLPLNRSRTDESHQQQQRNYYDYFKLIKVNLSKVPKDAQQSKPLLEASLRRHTEKTHKLCSFPLDGGKKVQWSERTNKSSLLMEK